jgi:hypothetical protein
VVHARQLGEQTLTFLVSGKLWRNSMIMQDDQTGTLWNHLTGEAMEGPLKGQQLEPIPSVQTSWAEWIRIHPESDVLRKETEIRSSRYTHYFDDPDRTGIFPVEWLTDRLPGKSLVHGIVRGSDALAVSETRISVGAPLHVTLNGDPIVLFRAPDGGVRAYLAQIETKVLNFRVSGRAAAQHSQTAELPAILDEETGSQWDLGRGVCFAGELAGAELAEILVRTAYWFAWSSYFPDTEVID